MNGLSRRRIRFLGTWIAAGAMAASAATARGDELAARIERVFRTLPDPQVHCGALVVDLASGKQVFAHNADRPLVPASNQKLVVLASAVDRYDATTGWETAIGLRGRDVVIVGEGDPGLGDAKIAADLGVGAYAFLDLWAHALIAGGSGHIAGDLVIDAGVFDDEYVHPDWEAGDLVKWYGAPVGGLNLANNCLEVTVWPGATARAPCEWSLLPPTPDALVINQCQSAPGRRGDSPTVGRKSGSFELVLSGRANERVTLQPVSAPDPVMFAASAIRAHLERKGVHIDGTIRRQSVRAANGNLPADLIVLARHRTPLEQILARIGGDSQNMCAESLFKKLGHDWAQARGEYGVPGSWSNGREAVSGFLHAAGCDLNTITIADGSGLSRRNRATATEFVHILSHMHAHPRREMFLSSLAGNVTGGTLRKRMRGVEGEVYAKTGYMSGVRALSGYVHTPGDRWYAFSVIFNGFSGSSRPYNDKLRELCQILSDAS